MKAVQVFSVFCCLVLTILTPIVKAQDESDIVADLQIECICNAQWNFDGSLLAVSVWPDIQIYETENWNLLNTIPEAYADYEMAWHPDKNQIATIRGGYEEGLRIWDAITGEVIKTLSRPFDPPNGGLAILRALAWSPDGSKIVTDSDGVDSLLLWDLMSDLPPEVLIASNFPQRPYFRIDSIEWGKNGKMLLLSGTDEVVNAGALTVTRIWDMENKKTLRSMYDVSEVQWGTDETQFASIYLDEIIAIWVIESGEIIRYANTPGDNHGFLSWNKSENLIASMNIDGEVQIWDVTTDGLFLVAHISTTITHAGSIDWKPNSTQLAIAGKGGVVIWNYEPNN